MRILLTGGTGLVGRALGKKLVQSGYEVTLLVRNAKRAHTEQSFPARIFQWDGISSPPPPEAFMDVEGVVHLAGEGIADERWTEDRKRKLWNSRILSTQLLAQGLSQSQVRLKSYVGASAIGIYGNRGQEPLDESAKVGSDFLAQLCQEWEKSHRLVSAQHNTCVRIGVVLSERGGFLDRVVSIFQKVGASSLGSGAQQTSWIHLEDLTNVLIACIQGKVSGVVNATAPHPISNAKLTQALAKQLDVMQMPPVPAAILKVAYGELSQILLEGQKVLPKKLQEMGFDFLYPHFPEALAPIFERVGPGEKKLVFESWVSRPRVEVFDFFCNEKNLETITPKSLQFHVLKKSTPQIQVGTLIDYRLKIHGIPVMWRTLISAFERNHLFIDEQLKGPYAKWHHTHTFSDLAGGTLISDEVIFKPPMGWLGRLVTSSFIESDVKGIFAFRTQTIKKLFEGH